MRTTGGEASASGGLWQVVTVGGKVSHSAAATHRVKLVLRPLAPDGATSKQFIVRDRESSRPE